MKNSGFIFRCFLHLLTYKFLFYIIFIRVVLLTAFFEQKIIKSSEFPFEVFIADNSVENISVEAHWHDCFEIMYNIVGEATQIINNKSINTNSGDIVFIKSGDIHSTVCRKDINTAIFVIKFMPDIIENYNCMSNSKYMAAFLNSNSQHIKNLYGDVKTQSEELMDRIFIEYEQKKSGFEMFIKSYIFALIGLFIREDIIAVPHINSSDISAEFSKIIDFIENNYNHDISLMDVSERLNMNYSYTSRYFKKITGKTFKQYLDFIRVSEADKKIHNTNKSLFIISEECGFASQQAFSRTYKRIRGYTAKVKKC